jgi:hypothetical protein|tara:strand:- start:535 stop:753 length:219 start_codon:yes stop_codon:yes gene_type:complete
LAGETDLGAELSADFVSVLAFSVLVSVLAFSVLMGSFLMGSDFVLSFFFDTGSAFFGELVSLILWSLYNKNF